MASPLFKLSLTPAHVIGLTCPVSAPTEPWLSIIPTKVLFLSFCLNHTPLPSHCTLNHIKPHSRPLLNWLQPNFLELFLTVPLQLPYIQYQVKLLLFYSFQILCLCLCHSTHFQPQGHHFHPSKSYLFFKIQVKYHLLWGVFPEWSSEMWLLLL